jgi:hypothetical protein
MHQGGAAQPCRAVQVEALSALCLHSCACWRRRSKGSGGAMLSVLAGSLVAFT